MNKSIADSKTKPISIRSLVGPESNRLIAKFAKFLDRCLGLDAMQNIYDLICSNRDASLGFEENFFKVTNTSYCILPKDLSYIPKEGPLIIVSNHPFGMLDGLAILAIFKKVRPDVRLMANHYLGLIPEIDEVLFGVDVFETKASIKRNISTLKEAINWLQQDNSLIVFPSGEVSHLHLKQKVVVDGQWSHTIARIQQLTKATILPVYFHGKNSMLFHLSGLLNPRLRTMLLPREFTKKVSKNVEVQVQVGRPITPIRLANFHNDREKTNFLRLCTYLQKYSDYFERTKEQNTAIPAIQGEAIIDPIPIEHILAEIEALPEQSLLHRHRNFSVFYARSHDIPHTLSEICRLREINFRLIGEGSGKSLDIDRYDQNYMQLFIWDHDTHAIVASCRFAKVDELLKKQGLEGLYTYSLFDFSHEFIYKMTPAIEFGRLFVNLNHRSKSHGLRLVWTGLLKWTVRNPHYRYFFGGVSISKFYTSMSHNLIIDFCKRKRYDEELAAYVTPRCPFQQKPLKVEKKLLNELVYDFDKLSELINQIDPNQTGVPMLFKKYQLFNYRVLGFNVDKDFSDVTDALTYSDLTTVSSSVLERFLEKDEAQKILQYHGRD